MRPHNLPVIMATYKTSSLPYYIYMDGSTPVCYNLYVGPPHLPVIMAIKRPPHKPVSWLVRSLLTCML
jgi:hypothetical protein